MVRNTESPSPLSGNRWRPVIWGTAAFLLLLPAIAMRFPGSGVDWDARDFIIMGAMFMLACGSYEVVVRISDNTSYRAASGIAIVTAFLTVWVNLAAGMLGSEQNPANLLFGGVLLVGLLGVVIAMFKPAGMARAMLATALAQAAMAVYALVGGYAEVTLHIAFFVLPWLLSAQLFKKAAREERAIGTAN